MTAFETPLHAAAASLPTKGEAGLAAPLEGEAGLEPPLKGGDAAAPGPSAVGGETTAAGSPAVGEAAAPGSPAASSAPASPGSDSTRAYVFPPPRKLPVVSGSFSEALEKWAAARKDSRGCSKWVSSLASTRAKVGKALASPASDEDAAGSFPAPLNEYISDLAALVELYQDPTASRGAGAARGPAAFGVADPLRVRGLVPVSWTATIAHVGVSLELGLPSAEAAGEVRLVDATGGPLAWDAAAELAEAIVAGAVWQSRSASALARDAPKGVSGRRLRAAQGALSRAAGAIEFVASELCPLLATATTRGDLNPQALRALGALFLADAQQLGAARADAQEADPAGVAALAAGSKALADRALAVSRGGEASLGPLVESYLEYRSAVALVRVEVNAGEAAVEAQRRRKPGAEPASPDASLEAAAGYATAAVQHVAVLRAARDAYDATRRQYFASLRAQRQRAREEARQEAQAREAAAAQAQAEAEQRTGTAFGDPGSAPAPVPAKPAASPSHLLSSLAGFFSSDDDSDDAALDDERGAAGAHAGADLDLEASVARLAKAVGVPAPGIGAGLLQSKAAALVAQSEGGAGATGAPPQKASTISLPSGVAPRVIATPTRYVPPPPAALPASMAAAAGGGGAAGASAEATGNDPWKLTRWTLFVIAWPISIVLWVFGMLIVAILYPFKFCFPECYGNTSQVSSSAMMIIGLPVRVMLWASGKKWEDTSMKPGFHRHGGAAEGAAAKGGAPATKPTRGAAYV